jgi:hypothetical protein
VEEEPAIMLNLLRTELEPPALPLPLLLSFTLDRRLCTWCSMAVRLPVKVRTSLLVWSSTYLSFAGRQSTV